MPRKRGSRVRLRHGTGVATLSLEGDEMTHSDSVTDIELARAFELVNAISERIEDEMFCLEEMDLRMSLLVAEAEGEIVTSAPPAWALAA